MEAAVSEIAHARADRRANRADRVLTHASLLLLALLLHLQLLRWLAPHFAAPDDRADIRVLQVRTLPARAALTAEAHAQPQPAEDQPQLAKSTPQRHAAPAPAALPAPDEAIPSSFTHSLHALTRQPELLGEGPQQVSLPETMQQPGSLLLRLYIDRHGVVQGVNVLRSSLAHEVEGQIVLQFYRATYRPGEIDGDPVDSEMLIQVAAQ